MTDANNPAPPSDLAATHATDVRQLGLAATQGSQPTLRRVPPEPEPEPETPASLGLLATSARQGADTTPAQFGVLETLASGRHAPLARPDLADPEERRRRQALKFRMFGEAEDAVKIGRFQVLGRLGAGGMGVVYTAYDERLDRKIAIKVLRSEGSGDQSRVRLQREAQAMARLSHPNIVAVHEVGEAEGGVFVAMEFVRGSSLDRWLETKQPWRRVVEVFSAAGRGLQAAHTAGLIHRDFKPANAILGDDGSVKVLDFGLARSDASPADEAQAPGSLMNLRLTRTGVMMGTPAYMSPEQLLGEPLTPASDQFSFFVALYEGLYRRLPFAGESLTELVEHVTSDRPAEAPAGSDVPAWLYRVVLRGLARAPADRFPDMAAALAALANDPARRRRRLAGALGLMLFSAGASVGAMQLGATDGGRCEGLAAATAPVWNDERIAAARTAFTTSAGSLGSETWTLLEPRLAAWVEQWVALRGDRCRAYAAGELSDTLHDRSLACLERQLARVDGLVSAFVVADQARVEQAPGAVAALPPLSLCADVDDLLAEVAPPVDPDARARVADGRAVLERARAAIDLGDYDGALASASQVAARARALNYEPLVALAEVVRGDALQWKRDVPGADAALGAGLELALASGDDRSAVEALARRIFVRAELAGQPERALADEAIDRALLRRISDDPRLAWLVENNIAVAHDAASDTEAAAHGYEAALRIAESINDGVSTEAIVSRYNLGLLRGEQRDFDRAAQLLAAAAAAGEKINGANHPALLPLLEGQANAAYALGRLAEALALCHRARALAGRLPTANPALLLPIVELEARIASQRRDPAAPALADEAANLARTAFGPNSPRVALALLQPQLHRDARADELDAAVHELARHGPSRWATALWSRMYGLNAAGRSTETLALLAEAQAAPAWSELPPETRTALGLIEAAARIAIDQPAQAAAILDEIESLAGPTISGPPRHYLDYHRGRIALRTGDIPAALTALRRAATGYAATCDPDYPEFLEVRAALVQALRAAGETSEADALATELIRSYRALGPAFAPEADALATRP
ncbi:serine/threonine-protein kinase [Nannocystis sp.]|uniref:serine/threonine-protein kinase n=1 Tax=Nannocystis sp. TaxID=1962667 RepID=UPI0025EC3804|nr:serine/threonine-protein kinase [Nannocystis sp.]